MSDVYVCMHKHARLGGGSGGMLPLEIFHELDALMASEAILGQKQNHGSESTASNFWLSI